MNVLWKAVFVCLLVSTSVVQGHVTIEEKLSSPSDVQLSETPTMSFDALNAAVFTDTEGTPSPILQKILAMGEKLWDWRWDSNRVALLKLAVFEYLYPKTLKNLRARQITRELRPSLHWYNALREQLGEQVGEDLDRFVDRLLEQNPQLLSY